MRVFGVALIVWLSGTNAETVSLMLEPVTRFMERVSLVCP